MWAIRIHGYALAVSFCFSILMTASQKTDPLEGDLFCIRRAYNNLNLSGSFCFFCPVILEFRI